MGRYDTPKTLEEATRNMDKKSPEYAEMVQKYKRIELQEIQKAEEGSQKHKMAIVIVDLCAPVKSISVSKLNYLKYDDLVEIGKAARALYKALDKAGRVSSTGYKRDKWSDDF